MYKAQQLDKAYYQGLEIENEDLRKLKHDYKTIYLILSNLSHIKIQKLLYNILIN